MLLHDMRDVEISLDGKTAVFTVQPQMATFGPDLAWFDAHPYPPACPSNSHKRVPHPRYRTRLSVNRRGFRSVPVNATWI